MLTIRAVPALAEDNAERILRMEHTSGGNDQGLGLVHCYDRRGRRIFLDADARFEVSRMTRSAAYFQAALISAALGHNYGALVHTSTDGRVTIFTFLGEMGGAKALAEVMRRDLNQRIRRFRLQTGDVLSCVSHNSGDANAHISKHGDRDERLALQAIFHRAWEEYSSFVVNYSTEEGERFSLRWSFTRKEDVEVVTE